MKTKLTEGKILETIIKRKTFKGCFLPSALSLFVPGPGGDSVFNVRLCLARLLLRSDRKSPLRK